MPYLTDEAKRRLDSGTFKPTKPGELNYVITRTINDYVSRQGRNYTVLNEVLGVLSAVAREFYRRVVTPYEDEKIEQNGDIEGWPT